MFKSADTYHYIIRYTPDFFVVAAVNIKMTHIFVIKIKDTKYTFTTKFNCSIDDKQLILFENKMLLLNINVDEIIENYQVDTFGLIPINLITESNCVGIKNKIIKLF